MGMGIFHTGIEVSGVEYAYGGGSVSASGVYTQTPRQAPPGSNWRFKMSQRLGKAKIPAAKIASALDKVREQFKGTLSFARALALPSPVHTTQPSPASPHLTLTPHSPLRPRSGARSGRVPRYGP
jgi:hypothetical protein